MILRKEIDMAYMCVLAPSRECDGCGECEENRDKPDKRWDLEADYDDEYCRYCDREE